MSRRFMCFPGFKEKAVTFSYDDGVRQDKRLIDIFRKNGLKGTFNLNGGLFNSQRDDEFKGRMTKEEALELYLPLGQEVAIHGYQHLSLAELEDCVATNDVISDSKELETLFGCVIKGMAYANGSYDDNTVEILKKCGVSYARTTVSTGKFDLPKDWLKIYPTCHHSEPRLMELAKEFVNSPPKKRPWSDAPRLFYLWGHSYEFDQKDNWNVIEEFAKYIGGRAEIWYATNGEIYEYIQAYDRLEFSADGSLVYNPSNVDVYIEDWQGKRIVPAGKTVRMAK